MVVSDAVERFWKVLGSTGDKKWRGALWEAVQDIRKADIAVYSGRYSEGGSGEYVSNEQAMNRFEVK